MCHRRRSDRSSRSSIRWNDVARKGDRSSWSPATSFCSQFQQTDRPAFSAAVRCVHCPRSRRQRRHGMRLADSAEVPPTQPRLKEERDSSPLRPGAASPIGERSSPSRPDRCLNTPRMSRHGPLQLGQRQHVRDLRVAGLHAVPPPRPAASRPQPEAASFFPGNPVILGVFRTARRELRPIYCDWYAVDVPPRRLGAERLPHLESFIGRCVPEPPPDGDARASSSPNAATLADCGRDIPRPSDVSTTVMATRSGRPKLSLPTGENFDCDSFTETDGRAADHPRWRIIFRWATWGTSCALRIARLRRGGLIIGAAASRSDAFERVSRPRRGSTQEPLSIAFEKR